MDDLISVIVPVYNTSQYLQECIDSVLGQTYRRFELILIDDGSTDDSPIICDNAEKKDDRIQVIHKTNGGLSSARNRGLLAKHGAYFTFVDSDDLLSPVYLERLLEVAKKYDAEWIQCGAQFGSTRIVADSRKGYEHVYSGKKALVNSDVKVRACGVLYRSDAYQNFAFPDVRIYEDEATTYKLIYSSNTAVRISDELYYYYYNASSLSKKDGDFIPDSFIQIFWDRIAYFESVSDEEMVIKSKEKFCRSLIVLYVRCSKNKNNRNNRAEYLKSIRSLTKSILFSNVPSFSSKCQCLLMSVFPYIGSKFAILFRMNSRF